MSNVIHALGENMGPGIQKRPVYASAGASSPGRGIQTSRSSGNSAYKTVKLNEKESKQQKPSHFSVSDFSTLDVLFKFFPGLNLLSCVSVLEFA